ncbi:MAG: TetR/AcrR family transcriptional regulator [Croceibacterium sp.]
MIVPAARQRARRNSRDEAADRMISVGRELLAERDIDQLSVKEIAEASGSSIGSFYNCFSDKDHYFACLIDDMVVRRKLGAKANFDEPFDKLPRALATGAIVNFGEHQGMIRSALRSHLLGTPVWEPIAAMSGDFVEKYSRRCSEHIGRRLTPSESKRVAFAFVWLYGMLMQQVMRINNIHGYDILDADFTEDTVRSFVSLLNDAIVTK